MDVFTPDLPTRCGGEGQAACNEPDEAAPLQGHVYLAQPECGGPGQPACSSAYAEGRGGGLSGEGRLFGLYIEVEGSGVIVKLPGTVSANPITGRLQATFKENPQFPFSELKLHLHGGPRAPLEPTDVRLRGDRIDADVVGRAGSFAGCPTLQR